MKPTALCSTILTLAIDALFLTPSNSNLIAYVFSAFNDLNSCGNWEQRFQN